MQIEKYNKPAELRLIQACREGDDTIFSMERPEKGSADNTIRAGLIRALLLGTGDCTPPARGLWIEGAWITGKLDLQGEALPVPLVLLNCTLGEDVMLRDCTLPALHLTGTHLPKLDAQRLQCNGPLHLRAGFQATGLVDLTGATIDGQLDCAGGKFLAKGLALNCDTISVGAAVFLRTGFEAQGEVKLVGAKIGGQLDCDRGKFLAAIMALNCNGISVGASVFLRNEFEAHGKVNLVRAKIDGQMACNRGKFLAEGIALHCDATIVGADVFLQDEFEARGRINLNRAEIAGNLVLSSATLTTGLDAQGMRVRAQFVWADIEGDGIEVDLIDAKVGTLVDSPGSWTSVKRLRLSSFRYDRIESKMDVQERLDWLTKHDASVRPFTPQPYVQLANVLRRQGMISAVNTVMIKREDLQRDADMKQAVQGNEWWGLFALVMLLRPFLSLPFKWMFGYGHQPSRVLFWIAVILGITICCAQQIHIHGQFAPTSSVVLTSQDWLDSFPTEPLHPDSPLWRTQMDAWAQTTSGRDYTSFSAFLYALDLFIPLDALGQEKNWAPSAERGGWGDWGHRLRWLVQMAGWVITAIGAAVLTGLIGRRD
ncbi:hypothetical protein [Planktomarina temperata]|uniref:hypothetical protein n=1 Tax=Planktomarina temperata TaxID=1284658 RepID=UPI002706620E|nr:hypothetical protein [Planktomarina temperata]